LAGRILVAAAWRRAAAGVPWHCRVTLLRGNGYSVLLAACSAFCPASFWSRSANLYGAEHFGELIDYFYAIHFVFRENGRHFPFNT